MLTIAEINSEFYIQDGNFGFYKRKFTSRDAAERYKNQLVGSWTRSKLSYEQNRKTDFVELHRDCRLAQARY